MQHATLIYKKEFDNTWKVSVNNFKGKRLAIWDGVTRSKKKGVKEKKHSGKGEKSDILPRGETQKGGRERKKNLFMEKKGSWELKNEVEAESHKAEREQ